MHRHSICRLHHFKKVRNVTIEDIAVVFRYESTFVEYHVKGVFLKYRRSLNMYKLDAALRDVRCPYNIIIDFCNI